VEEQITQLEVLAEAVRDQHKQVVHQHQGKDLQAEQVQIVVE
jgi:hypothetical protein